MSIKPIETHYNGYKFRSRLEARWAVFFDAMGIKYEYEPEGFEMDEVKYLPDFYLPDADRWIEIKGKKLTREDIEKCSRFCEAQDKEGVKFTIFIGQPSDLIIGIKPNKDKQTVSYTTNLNEARLVGVAGYSYQWKNYDVVDVFQGEKGEKRHIDEDPIRFMNPDLCEEDIPTRFMQMIWWDGTVKKEDLIKAALVSRRARFEHGETPEA